MSAPTVSVLMPVYNAKDYVASSIDSILAQTFTDFEIVMIDDGSTDGSTEILRDYANRDHRIKLISRPNTGLVKALNEGLQNCRGEFIARMDADDISLPHRFARQVEFLKANPDHVLVGSNWLFIDADGDVLCAPRQVFLSHEVLDAQLLSGKNYLIHPAVMLRTSAMHALGGYRPWPIGEDIDLWLRLAEIGKLCNLDETLFQYRVLAGSYSRTRKSAGILDQIYAEALSRRNVTEPLPPKAELPPSDPLQFTLSCCYRAMRDRNWRTARKHAKRALLMCPTALSHWTLMLRTVLRIRPETTRG